MEHYYGNQLILGPFADTKIDRLYSLLWCSTMDFRILHGDDAATLGKNSMNFGPVISEIMGVECEIIAATQPQFADPS